MDWIIKNLDDQARADEARGVDVSRHIEMTMSALGELRAEQSLLAKRARDARAAIAKLQSVMG